MHNRGKIKQTRIGKCRNHRVLHGKKEAVIVASMVMVVSGKYGIADGTSSKKTRRNSVRYLVRNLE